MSSFCINHTEREGYSHYVRDCKESLTKLMLGRTTEGSHP